MALAVCRPAPGGLCVDKVASPGRSVCKSAVIHKGGSLIEGQANPRENCYIIIIPILIGLHPDASEIRGALNWQ